MVFSVYFISYCTGYEAHKYRCKNTYNTLQGIQLQWVDV
jgi:hypothetical protein